ncbi:uncharacterized protein [Lolium perenne]|uniref:uncharacterized protein isoform X2 n=1 Tax=Lolium perenne TaxID=4522 RepID=UPI0021F5FA23|nr:uncharacterized protein LOC127327722 isoform X2 [Lolium perenne]
MGAEVTQISAFTTAAAHTLCFACLAVAHSLAGRGALVSDPALALRLVVVCEVPLIIVVFSLLRRDPKHCSFLKAAARGLLGLPIGAFLNAFGAVALGAPVGIKFWTATIYRSLLMSLFTVRCFCSGILIQQLPLVHNKITNCKTGTCAGPVLFVPAACVFGASKVDWQNALSYSIYFTSSDVVEYMISMPSHGAVIGAWLGAWPMPLDWGRPWQACHTKCSVVLCCGCWNF